MPFLAIPAVAAAAIGAGGSVASSLISKRGGGGGSSADPFGDLVKQKQLAVANDANAGANQDFTTARNTLQLPLNYWTHILTGGRSKALEEMSPDVQTITSQYDAGLRAVNEFSPRGGGRSSLMEETKYKRASDITNTLLRARPAAATNLNQIGTEFAAMGSSNRAAAVSALGGASSTDANQQRIAIERQQMQNQQASDIGSGLGGILATLLYSRKSGTTPTGGTPPFVPSSDPLMVSV